MLEGTRMTSRTNKEGRIKTTVSRGTTGSRSRVTSLSTNTRRPASRDSCRPSRSLPPATLSERGPRRLRPPPPPLPLPPPLGPRSKTPSGKASKFKFSVVVFFEITCCVIIDYVLYLTSITEPRPTGGVLWITLAVLVIL